MRALALSYLALAGARLPPPAGAGVAALSVPPVYQLTASNASDITPAFLPQRFDSLASALHGMAQMASAWDTVLLWRISATDGRELVLRYDVDGYDL